MASQLAVPELFATFGSSARLSNSKSRSIVRNNQALLKNKLSKRQGLSAEFKAMSGVRSQRNKKWRIMGATAQARSVVSHGTGRSSKYQVLEIPLWLFNLDCRECFVSRTFINSRRMMVMVMRAQSRNQRVLIGAVQPKSLPLHDERSTKRHQYRSRSSFRDRYSRERSSRRAFGPYRPFRLNGSVPSLPSSRQQANCRARSYL